MEIYDFNNLEENGKMYGGAAGRKSGVVIDGKNWLLKFPQNIRGFKRVEESYSSSPLSEYIGSHIYEILGIPVHETRLGIKDGKLVVACKDFRTEDSDFYEYREIKNNYNKQLEEKLEQNIAVTGGHGTILSSLLIHLKYNPVLCNNKEVEKQLWDQAIIDGLINNNDRNSGNWGVIIKGKEIKPSPVFDNAASFFNKSSDSKLEKQLNDFNAFKDINIHLQTAFNDDGGHAIPLDVMLNKDIDGLKDEFLNIVPKFYSNINSIVNMVNEIPNYYKEIPVMSEVRKVHYLEGIIMRYNEIVYPRYKAICEERSLTEEAQPLMTLREKREGKFQ